MSFLFGSSSTTTPTLTPQGQGLYNTLNGSLSNILTDPSAGMGPIQTAGEQQINSAYAGSADAITRMMSSRGYGSSGNMGNTMYATDLSRLSSLSGFKGQMAQLDSSRQLNSASILEQMLGTQVGKNTQTMDPSSFFSGLGSLLSSGILGGGGGGGGGGGLQSYSTIDGAPGATWINSDGSIGGTPSVTSGISYGGGSETGAGNSGTNGGMT